MKTFREWLEGYPGTKNSPPDNVPWGSPETLDFRCPVCGQSSIEGGVENRPYLDSQGIPHCSKCDTVLPRTFAAVFKNYSGIEFGNEPIDIPDKSKKQTKYGDYQSRLSVKHGLKQLPRHLQKHPDIIASTKYPK